MTADCADALRRITYVLSDGSCEAISCQECAHEIREARSIAEQALKAAEESTVVVNLRLSFEAPAPNVTESDPIIAAISTLTLDSYDEDDGYDAVLGDDPREEWWSLHKPDEKHLDDWTHDDLKLFAFAAWDNGQMHGALGGEDIENP